MSEESYQYFTYDTEVAFLPSVGEPVFRVPGKRLWYAPWKRAPDMVISAREMKRRMEEKMREEFGTNLFD